jgi:chromosome segregation ATPase
VIWQCNSKFKEKCTTPHIDEESIKRLFVSAVNQLITDKDEIISNFNQIRQELSDTSELEAERAGLQNEMTVVSELIQKCIDENARFALDQAEYQERYNGLASRFEAAKSRHEEVAALISEKKIRAESMESFFKTLAAQDGVIADFDERLWYSLVDYATVYGEKDMRFRFKDGTEIKA